MHPSTQQILIRKQITLRHTQQLRSPNDRLTKASTVTACLILMILSALTAHAQITWGSPTQIVGDTDISTTGSLLYAYNLTDPGDLIGASVTINTVPFTGFATNGAQSYSSGSDFTISANPGHGVDGDHDLGNALVPNGAMSSNYITLLKLGSSTLRDSLFLSVNVAQAGTYQLQLWVNYSSWTDAQHPSETVSDNFGNSIQMQYNTEPTTKTGGNGLGQYVIGTFTAPAGGGSQLIRIDALQDVNVGASAILNAFQVRQIPSLPFLGMLTLGAGLLLGSFRFRYDTSPHCFKSPPQNLLLET